MFLKLVLVLIYKTITWPSPDFSTYPATVGIYGGRNNPGNTYLVPGSCTFSLLNITEMSNIGVPGKFVFRVDKQTVLPEISGEQFQVPGSTSTVPSISYETEIPGNSFLMPSAGSARYVFGDDGYSSIDIQSNFTFLGKAYDKVFVNGNGLLTFGLGN